MSRRSLLKCAALIAIFIAGIFKLPALVYDNTASAATQQQQTSGSLRAFDKAGKPAGECPLKHTEVKAKISGFLSRVTVTQIFENPFADKIEAVYIFPLPPAAAVDDLTMVIGDRTIKGKVMRREEAKAAYTNAKQLGKVASLLDQERPNIFTQQVANIMPGQQIHVTISYVETLKYNDGFYEWSFPMVVAPRYNPAHNEAAITPPTAAEGMRAGHDISLELDLDAGVPIVEINSETHETEVREIDEKHAVVQLKDRTTIPNKDFVLTYRVAGENINDAVLAHRSERGGFFTLILQPPQRVFPRDVMPKEIVFVLDTSGSMEGFPIETAKQTMQLALDTLNPHDTFNLITFSGDTDILFSDPVPATPENLRKAKKFISDRKGEGGTEMMKAIKAALDPSDSQHHVRLACFMTDGQVGNDQEILAEIQKHPNARIFALGFGSNPNRSLLDKMAQYGRGEIDYIPETGGKSAVAQRFNERIRNPLLTDLSIDWSDLPITEVYPKHIPDLFSAKPLIVSGRYEKGAKGIIRLKGKMAGQDFVREIPVELPEVENEHDVLANLWAKRRLDDLIAEEIANAADQTARDQKREEITEIGLKFKLMTQYTSFIAIDDVIFTGTEEPRRVEVPVDQPFPGTLNSLVMVTASADALLDSDSVVRITSDLAIQNLPIQGRSFSKLVPLVTGTAAPGPAAPGIFQTEFWWRSRQTANSFTIDGVNANFGIAQGGAVPGPSASGNVAALTASGGANGLASMDTIQEITVRIVPEQPEYSRAAGTQVEVVTKSGTNEFHGSAFEFFGNDVFDANDWFANSRGLRKPAKRLNLFGATLGGPIKRDQTFFFASYEGMRLQQPVTGITEVPSLSSRQAAPGVLRPFLEAFPLPTGDSRPDGFAEFAAAFTNPARHDVGSFRWDHLVNNNTSVVGRYSFANSNADLRGENGSSLNTINRIQNRAQTITGLLTRTVSSTMVLDLRANYSRMRVDGSYLLDQFGGAAIPSDLFTTPFTFDLHSRNAALIVGDEATNVQRQFNLIGSVTMIRGSHDLKFGGDFRRLSPTIELRPSEENAFFDGVAQAITGVAARVNHVNYISPQTPVFNTLSLYAQDEWRKSQKFTLNYGLRWDLAPPPSGEQVFAVDQVNNPTTLKLRAPGSSLWKTTFGNFAPRAGFAYELANARYGELMLRGGVGLVYDLGQDLSGDVFAHSIPFISGSAVFNSTFQLGSPGATTSNAMPFIVFDPELKLPYTINWNVSLQQALGYSQNISAAYIGSSGRRLTHTQTLLDQNQDFSFLRVITNRGSSDYHALQIKFHRRLYDGLTALASYTWSRSLDNVNEDSARNVIMTSSNREFDRELSDFDIRHQFTGFISYALPAPIPHGIGNKLVRNWAIDSIFTTRSARPVYVVRVFPTSFGLAYIRPDVGDGVPRLQGFPLYQVDLALRRKFSFTDNLALQIQTDAFNVFNHANFEDPIGNDLVLGNKPTFGQSTSLVSGPRTLRFSVKLMF